MERRACMVEIANGLPVVYLGMVAHHWTHVAARNSLTDAMALCTAYLTNGTIPADAERY